MFTQSGARSGFAYTPPVAIARAIRVLLAIESNGFPPELLREVLRGIRRYTPHTRVLVAEHTDVSDEHMLDRNMRTVDLEELPLRQYTNVIPGGKARVTASSLLADVRLCIALGTLKPESTAPPLLSAIHQTAAVGGALMDAYFALGDLFVGGVVVTPDKVIWGDDLLDVEMTAYRQIGHPLPEDLKAIHKTRRELAKNDS